MGPGTSQDFGDKAGDLSELNLQAASIAEKSALFGYFRPRIDRGDSRSVEVLDDPPLRCVRHRTIQHVNRLDMSRFQHRKCAGHVCGAARSEWDEFDIELTRRGVKLFFVASAAMPSAIAEEANSPSVSKFLPYDSKAPQRQFILLGTHS